MEDLKVEQAKKRNKGRCWRGELGVKISQSVRIWDPSCVCVSSHITRGKLREEILPWFMGRIQSVTVEKHIHQQLGSRDRAGSGACL